MKNKNYIIVFFVILFAGITRMIPHLDNFAGMEALALFGGAYYTRKYLTFLVPLAVMYFFDFIINNTIARSFFPEHQGLVWFSNYMIYNALSYVVIGALGSFVLQKVKPASVIGASLLSSLIFFGITNFGSWISPTSLYPSTSEGLMMSYVNAIPFLKSSALSTLVFSIILFGGFELFKKSVYNQPEFAK
ncbi:MAG: hypothetical protein IPL63_13005 [Saprospiraceae bacterium]|nr:hypothetical protein [Saprospiraceae bacterium]MBK6566110.1 hypothetical protein [Saprospiraceae bacterium]MBK8369872.1 hypothetical protein [Saprospiraceae bacterium]MBK8548242.1 hypothetical protein [Saprospiraceae bacterium]MBK8855785.1 hypothetical protein [Saprospiraceae bacterium]